MNPLNIATQGLINGITSLAVAVQGFFGSTSRFLPNGGGVGHKHHELERWQDHVPSFVVKEQRKAALEKQQRQNAAILALAI